MYNYLINKCIDAMCDECKHRDATYCDKYGDATHCDECRDAMHCVSTIMR